MKLRALLVAVVLATQGLAADSRHIEADDKTDFSSFKTFIVREGRASSRKAEIDNPLTLKTIQQAIREALSSKGLKETQDQPDLVVTFTVSEEPQRVVTGRGIRDMQAARHSMGALVIDIAGTGTTSPVWRGTYADEESHAANLAKNLPNDAKKLLSEYPPKKKR